MAYAGKPESGAEFIQATDSSIGVDVIATGANPEDGTMASDSGNWTGTGWAIGSNVLTHVAGSNAATLAGYAATASANYMLTMTINTTTAGTITIAYGGTQFATVGRQTGSQVWVVASSVISTAGLVLTPNATWEGTIDLVSIRRIALASSAILIKNNTDSTTHKINSPVGTSLGFGESALVAAQATATENSCFGYKAGRNTLTGTGNCFFGAYAGDYTSTGTYNVFVGQSAGQNNTIGVRNIAIGHYAKSDGYRGDGCVHIGYFSGRYNIASYNVSVGYLSLAANIVGAGCVAVGYSALAASMAEDNTGIGWNALATNTTGIRNTAVGYSAGLLNLSGSYNTFLGRSAGYTNSTGSSNICIGHYAGYFNVGSNKLYIDNNNRSNTAGDDAGAIITGTMSSTPANQTLTINAATTVSSTITSKQFKLSALNTAPSSSTDNAGNVGDVRIGATAIYVCVSATGNRWLNAPLATF